MKFLVAIPKETVNDDKWATAREPVVPCFPSQSSGAFLAVPSFRFSEKAAVAETDADPDRLADALAKEYPGLPRTLHENYVLKVFEAVFDAPLGTVYRIAVSQKQAMLIDDKSSETKILWQEQPIA